MASIDETLAQITSRYAEHEEVEAVLLAGSRATDDFDPKSDFDLYIYGETILHLDKRKSILCDFSDHMEYNNQYWETGDEGFLRDSHIGIDIMYRDLNWIRGEMERVVFQHQAGTGYTTCIWYNLLNSKILFDRRGKLTALREKVNIAYPRQLKQNIINKNYPLLRDSVCSYYNQIQKALGRDDFISLIHRTAAFFESYFDIIFAINEMPHPGEKKIVRLIQNECSLKPNNFKANIRNVFSKLTTPGQDLLSALDELIDNLDVILTKTN